MNNEPPMPSDATARQMRVRGVVEELISRRVRGEQVSDDEVRAAHRELQPELDDALEDLRMIEAARVTALDRTASVDGPTSRRITSHALPTDAFIGYTILGELHRGGQGVVYRAIQSITQRAVAIKVMREGFLASPAELSRFEREVRVLGALNHPNIVAIHDTGVTASGHAYFVMDYVDGNDLDEFARQFQVRAEEGSKALDPSRSWRRPGSPASNVSHRGRARAILAMFAKICDAVNAAHLLGIIHRDLKPSNIRVDLRGEPRILDFGLAKSSGGQTKLAGPNITATGQFVGTIPWASPEQLGGRSELIDTRSDVYSLGVILYQLLSGSFPYDMEGGIHEVMERVLRAEPRRLQTAGSWVDDEVETMVLKCLAKEPQRRYQTAGELERDIRHYLADEPIEAKRDSGWYLAKKKLRRLRFVIGVGSAFLALTALALVALFIQFDKQRDLLSQVMKARVLAESTGTMAQREAKAKTEAYQLLGRLYSSVDPRTARGRDVSLLLDVLDTGSKELDRQEVEDPAVGVPLLTTIGASYRSLGLFDRADASLTKALAIGQQHHGDDHADVAWAMRELAILRQSQGQFPAAEEHYRHALAIRTRLHGKEHLDIAQSNNDLGVFLYAFKGDPVEAMSYLRDARAMYEKLLGTEDERVVMVTANLAEAHRLAGDPVAAGPLFQEAIARLRALHQGPHPDLASTLTNYGLMLRDQGDLIAAEAMHRAALEQGRKLYAKNPELCSFLNNLGSLLTNRDQLQEGESLLREGIAMSRAFGREMTQEFARMLGNLAFNLYLRQAYAEAEKLYREAVDIIRRMPEPNPTFLATCLEQLAGTLREARKLDEAELRCREALKIRQDAQPGHVEIADSLVILGRILQEKQDYPGAESAFRECLAIRKSKLPEGHWAIFNTRSLLGGCLAASQRFEEAEPMLLGAYEGLLLGLGPDHGRTKQTGMRIVELYEAWNKKDAAVEWRAKLQAATKP